MLIILVFALLILLALSVVVQVVVVLLPELRMYLFAAAQMFANDAEVGRVASGEWRGVRGNSILDFGFWILDWVLSLC